MATASACFVPSFLELSMESLAMEQDRLREKYSEAMGTVTYPAAGFPANPFGAAALEAIEAQARQNAAMFQQAMSMFSPFGGLVGGAAAANTASGRRSQRRGRQVPASQSRPSREQPPSPAGKSAAADGDQNWRRCDNRC